MYSCIDNKCKRKVIYDSIKREKIPLTTNNIIVTNEFIYPKKILLGTTNRDSYSSEYSPYTGCPTSKGPNENCR